MTNIDDALPPIEVRCPYTAKLVGEHLDPLPYGNSTIRLVQFSHDSPGLRGLRSRIGEAISELIVNDPAALEELHKAHLAGKRKAKATA